MKLLHANVSFLRDHRAVINLSAHTTRAYEADLHDFRQHMGKDIGPCDVDKEALQGYIRHMREKRNLKETTIKRRIACLKLFFKWATEEKLLFNDPFDHLKERIRLPKRLPRALGKEELSRLKAIIVCNFRADDLEAVGAKIALGLLIATGIRVGELVSITVEDIDLPNRTIKIHGKGNRQRIAYLLDSRLSKSLYRYLALRELHVAGHAYLLVDKSGGPATTDYVRRLLRRTAKAVGISRTITPHMLRHTAATLWLEAGLDIRYVQKLLGHHSISTTEMYTHVTDNGLRSALNKLVRTPRRTDN